MKTRTYLYAIAASLAGTLAFSSNGLAAIEDDIAAAQDYGDLIILYRDADGVPYLTADKCQQPLPTDTCTEECELVPGVPAGVDVIPVDPGTCAVPTACATCTEEVDFGRISEARSPEEVFQSQLTDVIINLATSDCIVSLDPAGRMVTSAGTIDSPLQNLAVYRQLMLTGDIGVALPQGASILDTAARGLGVASDKTGEVNVDLVAYLNQIMGLSDKATPTFLDKICIEVKEEVEGTVVDVEKCFLDYGAYGYDRGLNFGSLPAPAYIPTGIPETSNDGWFEYLAVLDLSVPSFEILQGPITTAMFADELFSDGNIGGFAQASDDTRAVIKFMHDWAIPDADVFATPVPCVDITETSYEVLINGVSGFQVPKNYVNGGEREFTVTVTNEGPDLATGTVTVTADEAGESGTGGLGIWVFPFTALAADADAPFVQLFRITATSDTIEWKAVVEAEFDVLETNNTRLATSDVRASGGGGGGH